MSVFQAHLPKTLMARQSALHQKCEQTQHSSQGGTDGSTKEPKNNLLLHMTGIWGSTTLSSSC